jgi:hypothetical protein
MPNIISLNIQNSYIPLVRFELFNGKLSRLEEISLCHNGIRTIRENAFHALTELKSVNLACNEIKHLNHKIFEKNKKLEFIELSENKIQALHPELFDGLPKLKEVIFEDNPNISEVFSDRSEIGNGWIEAMKHDLKPLFDNYRASESSNVEALKKV